MGASFAYHSICKLKTCSSNSFHSATRSRSVEPVTASITAKVCCSWDGWEDRPMGWAALSLFPASSNADDSAGHLYSILLFSVCSQGHSERGEYAAGWTHENLTHFTEGRTGAQDGLGISPSDCWRHDQDPALFICSPGLCQSYRDGENGLAWIRAPQGMEQQESGDGVSLKLPPRFSAFWASGLLAQDGVCLLPCRAGLCSTSHTPSLGPAWCDRPHASIGHQGPSLQACIVTSLRTESEVSGSALPSSDQLTLDQWLQGQPPTHGRVDLCE